MGLDDLLGDAEAKAGMGAELLAGRTLAVEALEDRLQLVGRNARSLVLDLRHHPGALARGAQRHGPARGAEGHRIGDQVAEDLPEAALQPGHREILVAGDVQPDRGPAAIVGRLMQFCQRVEQAGDIDRLRRVARQLGIEAGGIRDIGDEPVEAPDILLDDRHEAALLVGVLDAGRRLDRAAQRGEGVLDLVRHVGCEPLVRVQPLP